MKLKGFDYIYILIVLVDLYAIYYYPGLRMIVKPLIVSSLLIYYIQETGKMQQPIIMTALMFALIGDIFLLFDFPLFFQLGIAAFLIMQLCYISYFKRYFTAPKGNKLYYSIVAILAALIFNFLFFDKLGGYKIHVIVYSIAISIMVFMGINQSLSNSIFIGSLFFLVSDFTLAFHKFVSPDLKFLPFIVMATYAIAQYMIVKGVSVIREING